MGRKIFVSYKYADDQVENLKNQLNSTVRDYVNEFERVVDATDDIFKGESDGDDLSRLTEDAIWDKLKNRIYDSSVTVVFVSPGMKDMLKSERDQWIPWEVSYSLKETSRKNINGNSVTSHSNAMIAVILPDRNGYYTYYFENKNCCASGCEIHYTDKLFLIIKENKFNRVKNSSKKECDHKQTVWSGTCSYIEAVRWKDFINNYHKYIERAIDRQIHIDEYKIHKDLK